MSDNTDFDPWDGLNDKHARAIAAQQLYDRGVVSQQWIPSMIDGWHPGMEQRPRLRDRLTPDLRYLNTITPTPEERQEMTWTNPEAASMAREILTEEKKESLRGAVTAAVDHFRQLLEGAHCGSVFSFMKTNDKGKHYWYAAIKNGDVWYTTAQNPRTIEGDDKFIEWLIGLGAHESAHSELTAGAVHEMPALDATSTDSSQT